MTKVVSVKGIRLDENGTRRFNRAFRVSVLGFLNQNPDKDAACRNFKITKRELARILVWKKHVDGRLKYLRPVAKDVSLRERLYEKALASVEKSFDEISDIIEANPILQDEKGLEFLPTVVSHLKNRGQNAIKLLEGTGDLRKSGDDLPNQGPRVPMFTLPPGSHVAVTITTGETNETERFIGRGSTESPSQIRNETVDAEVQVRQPSGGEGDNHGIIP